MTPARERAVATVRAAVDSTRPRASWRVGERTDCTIDEALRGVLDGEPVVLVWSTPAGHVLIVYPLHQVGLEVGS